MGQIEAADIEIMKLPHAADLDLPSYKTAGAAGMDLCAAIEDDFTLASGEIAKIPTGICIALPTDCEAQIRPRSGLAATQGVTILNAPGTIDSDYRGEIQIVLINHGQQEFTIKRGARIAQMVIAPVTRGTWIETKHLSQTQRGSGGFGSTGGTI